MSEEKELAPLLQILKGTEGQGNGAAIFASKGLGLSREPASAAAEFLKSAGWRVVSGTWEEGAAGSGLDAALAEFGGKHTGRLSPPSIVSAYVFNKAGLCFGKFEAGEDEMDSDIFTGMFTAVENFIQDSMNRHGAGLERATIQGREIFAESGDHLSIVMVAQGSETPSMRSDLKALLGRIEQKYGKELLSGRMGDAEGLNEMLEVSLNERKYREEFISQSKLLRMQEVRNALLGLERSSKSTPVAVVLDNAHLADDAALSFIYEVARSSARNRILLVAAYGLSGDGEADANAALEGTISLLHEEGICSKIELKAEKLSAALAPRLGEVGEAELRILAACALSGPEIEPEVVAAASGADAETVSEALASFEKAGFILAGRFKGRSRADEITSRTDGAREIALAAAAAIERIHSAHIGEHSERLARLYSMAPDDPDARKKAVEYSLMSASNALGTQQNELALEHYNRALALADDPKKKVGILENIILIERAMGMHDRLAHCDMLLEAASEAEDARGMANAHRERASIFSQQKNVKRAEEEFGTALALYTQEGDLEGMAYTLTGMALVRLSIGRHGDAEAELEKAVECAEACGSRRQLVVAKTAFASLYKAKGDHEKSLQFNEDALEALLELGDKWGVSVVLNNIAGTYFMLGKRAKASGNGEQVSEFRSKAIEFAGKSCEAAKEAGSIGTLALASNMMAAAHLELDGGLNEAERFSKDGRAYAMRAGNPVQAAVAATNLKDVYGRLYRINDGRAREAARTMGGTDMGKKIGDELDRLDEEMKKSIHPFSAYFGAAEKEQPNAPAKEENEKNGKKAKARN